MPGSAYHQILLGSRAKDRYLFDSSKGRPWVSNSGGDASWMFCTCKHGCMFFIIYLKEHPPNKNKHHLTKKNKHPPKKKWSFYCKSSSPLSISTAAINTSSQLRSTEESPSVTFSWPSSCMVARHDAKAKVPALWGSSDRMTSDRRHKDRVAQGETNSEPIVVPGVMVKTQWMAENRWVTGVSSPHLLRSYFTPFLTARSTPCMRFIWEVHPQDAQPSSYTVASFWRNAMHHLANDSHTVHGCYPTPTKMGSIVI